MRIGTKWALLGALALTTLGAAPVGASHDRGDRCDSDRSGRYSSSYDRRGGDDLLVFGLTYNQRLVCFQSDAPGDAEKVGRIDDLVGDTRLVGIDFRVANGELYGQGDQGGIYIIETDDASTSKVGQLTIPLRGTNFGVDFNPAADALRIISDEGQNLRHPFAGPTAGTTVNDGTLNYVGPPAVSPALGVTAAGYTNNDTDPDTATTLYDLDSNLDQTVIQAPPNAGTLNAVGKTGVDISPRNGFDVYSIVRDGTAQRVRAFAALKVNGDSGFYRINLVNGQATFIGGLPFNLDGVAIPLNQI
ncbi:MAG: DUF4394 domain-containing protein [Chloroflexota bacterium]|nr:DUF4394 domain-containing protein [Chloroflexota bacterium]